jgi:hypothetical protein
MAERPYLHLKLETNLVAGAPHWSVSLTKDGRFVRISSGVMPHRRAGRQRRKSLPPRSSRSAHGAFAAMAAGPRPSTAILESEMTIALLAQRLDPGIGMVHADIDGRASLALDAIEAIRPYVEYWLFTYLQATAFANRDFHELPDGEVRLSHPLTSHLAHTAALWRKASEPIAEWLARSFHLASSHTPMRAALALPVAAPSRKSALQPLITEIVPTLAPPLPTFITAAGGRRISAPSVLKQRAGVRDDPVPATCWECGRALPAERRAFCSDDCADSYRQAMGKRRPVVEPVAHRSREQRQEATLAGRRAALNVPASDRKALRHWYPENLQPRLSRMHPTEIAVGTAMGRSYAYYIVAGTRIPHPRHFPSLAALVGVELSKELAAVMSSSEG